MKESFVFLLGCLLVLVPFLGIPEDWKQNVIAGSGFILILVGYLLRRQLYLARFTKKNGEREADSFVETTDKLF